MRIVLRVPSYLHPLRIRLQDGREGSLVSRALGPAGGALCVFEVPGSEPVSGRYMFSEVRIPLSDIRPAPPPDRGPTLVCFDCGAMVPAAEAYHKRTDPSFCLCEACFHRWESAGRAREKASTG